MQFKKKVKIKKIVPSSLILICREYDKKSKLSEKLKKNFEDFEKEDVEIREGIKHAKENIKKIQKNISSEEEKVAKITKKIIIYNENNINY